MPLYQYGDRIPSVHESVFVAPNASVIGSVVLSENVSVWFGATIRGDNDIITLGKNSNVQEGAVLHTDPGIALTVGENATAATISLARDVVGADEAMTFHAARVAPPRPA